MGRWFPLLLGGAALLVATQASAKEVYVCEQNGAKVFSQTPCGADAKVENVGDRTVAVAINMPANDIAYFCRVALRAWDQSGVDAQNGASGFNRGYNSYDYRYNRYRNYRNSMDDSQGRAKTYILSHVANLEQLAREEPTLYHMVIETAERYSYNSGSRDYQYSADRGGASVDCQQRFETLLQETARRRFDADQSHQKQLMKDHGG